MNKIKLVGISTVSLVVAGVLVLAFYFLSSQSGVSGVESQKCLATNTGYEFCVDPELLKQLTGEEMQASDGDFQKEVFDFGAISASTIYYTDLTKKQEHILLSVFLFPAEKFDAAANPNEPPRFGQEVIRTDGKVLSVAGPTDAMFEPSSQDGMNITALYELMYDAKSWQK